MRPRPSSSAAGPRACAQVPDGPGRAARARRSSRRARGPRDGWAGLAARGSSLAFVPGAGPLGRAPRQRWLRSGIDSALPPSMWLEDVSGAAAREPPQPPPGQGQGLGGRPVLGTGNWEEEAESR